MIYTTKSDIILWLLVLVGCGVALGVGVVGLLWWLL